MTLHLRAYVLMALLLACIAPGLALAEGPPAEKVAVSLDTGKPMPSSPGFHLLKCTVTIGANKIPCTFGLFLPPGYFGSKEAFPMVVTLHNRGAGNWLDGEGMGLLWASDRWDGRDPTSRPADAVSLRKNGRFIGVAPECPRAYGFEHPAIAQMVSELIGQLTKVYRVDEERVYLTGFSYGATCTWLIAEQIPQRFAAIVPISSRATSRPAETVKRLKSMPIYLVSGEGEWAMPTVREMADALKSGGHSDYVYRVIKGGSHWCYPAVYVDPKFWDWLLGHKRKTASAGGPATSVSPAAQR